MPVTSDESYSFVGGRGNSSVPVTGNVPVMTAGVGVADAQPSTASPNLSFKSPLFPYCLASR